MRGRCECGNVRYRVAGDAVPAASAPVVYACHCLTCQRTSGSAFALYLFAPEADFTVDGETVAYDPGAGRAVRHACATCRTGLYKISAALTGFVVLHAGTMEDACEIMPAAHIWTRRKQAWIKLPEGVPTWPENPTPQEFAAAVL